MVYEGVGEPLINYDLPVVESCPSAVLVHFPTQERDQLVWTNMYLNSIEAMEFGMRIMAEAEASILQEHDS